MDLNWLYKRLAQYYGNPDKQVMKDKTLLLIKTVLSQNTNDKNRDRAMNNLMKKYESPDQILEADKDEIYQAIKVAGLGNTKSERIKKILSIIKERNKDFSLDFLEKMNLEEARQWLLELPGVGFKTASVLLNFGFNKEAFPVDTHCQRVLKRLGVVEEKMKPADISKYMEERIEEGKAYRFHVNIIEHGRQVCKAPEPLCDECFLTGRCKYYKENRS